MGTSVSIVVSDEIIASTLCSGFEGGVGYWARIEGYEEPTDPPVAHLWGDEVYRHVDYPLCPGGAVYVRATDEGDTRTVHRLDRAAVDRGLALMAEKYPHHWRDLVSETGDATTGDVLIQLALLGELVYG